MSVWLQQQASSHRVQLAAVAIVSGLAVAGSIFTIQTIRRNIAVEELKAEISSLENSHNIETVDFGQILNIFAPAKHTIRFQITNYPNPISPPRVKRTNMLPSLPEELETAIMIQVGYQGALIAAFF